MSRGGNRSEAWVTGIGKRGGFWTVTVEVIDFSQKEKNSSEFSNVYTVDPVSKNCELISKIGGQWC